MSVTNKLNQGTISLPVTYTNYGAPFRDGTNLVGNPYPSEINWDAPGWTKTNIDNAVYLWDPNLGTNGQYLYYVGGVASPSRTNPGIIASSQGFFVKANAANPVLTITEAVKTTAGHTANFRSGSSTVPNVLRLQLMDNSTAPGMDEAVIRFKEDANEGFDKDYDAYKMYNSTLNIYSNPQGTGLDLSVNSFALSPTPQVVPLTVNSNKKGGHRINASGFDSFTEPVQVYLMDRYKGLMQEIQEGDTYDFQVTTDTGSYGKSRFALLLGRTQVATGQGNTSLGEMGMKVYPNPNEGRPLQVELYGMGTGTCTVTVRDVTGSTVLMGNYELGSDLYGQVEVSGFAGLPNGMYTVYVQSPKKTLLQKVILVR
ncbi:MAG: T9SS type A sorting domain-containing protein [Cytophagales bacterium]|nr:T9SS type A sorting domain-containing protein [Cytophagales bacterium]